MKKCAKCKEMKSLESFETRNRYNADGKLRSSKPHSYCRTCLRRGKRSTYLKRNYKIIIEDYEKLSKSQNGKCAICRKECVTGKVLAVDHCHTSGKVRGLLCMRCNRAVGLLEDSTDNLRRALKYLDD